jgi:hypothetical protein
MAVRKLVCLPFTTFSRSANLYNVSLAPWKMDSRKEAAKRESSCPFAQSW